MITQRCLPGKGLSFPGNISYRGMVSIPSRGTHDIVLSGLFC